ncbi:MAG: DNA repair protein RecO [Candidatus Cloacimonetes bacterium]|jgi:DNA repair protein RecO (recombination protein O)|nr:DNA repair protein RecO [Candidatus Cloacimonadota bacterium]MBT6994600.1 DNA repair protein RecO [Candidatus Cloacimonadota bacterium]MBT7469100.1 DNA repair protein RecO [Candidatus Cloacimonadota bacterium]
MRDIKTKGIILRKIAYRETSVILDVLTPDFGVITVMAKGIRKAKSKSEGLLEILNEVDLLLYKKPNSDWYLYKSATIINANIFGINFDAQILMQAATEIYRQLIIHSEESIEFYELLNDYFGYIKLVKKNGIAIFWRFLLKIYKIYGISLNLQTCVLCGGNLNEISAYYPHKHGFICQKCFRANFPVIGLANEVTSILAQIYDIGNQLENISISKSAIKQINRIFLLHLSEQFHKKFYLKSIELLTN